MIRKLRLGIYLKEKQMNKQQANKAIGKKYVGTLKADFKIREGWK